MITNSIVGALTTIFTPPASCSDVITLIITSGSTAAWKGVDDGRGDASCGPPSYLSMGIPDWTYYSPGICPHGWTSATRSGETSPSTVGLETTAMCCPRCAWSYD